MGQGCPLDVDYLDHVVQVISGVLQVTFYLDSRADLVVLLYVFKGCYKSLDLSSGVG